MNCRSLRLRERQRQAGDVVGKEYCAQTMPTLLTGSLLSSQSSEYSFAGPSRHCPNAGDAGSGRSQHLGGLAGAPLHAPTVLRRSCFHSETRFKPHSFPRPPLTASGFVLTAQSGSPRQTAHPSFLQTSPDHSRLSPIVRQD